MSSTMRARRRATTGLAATKRDFPIFRHKLGEKPLVYLDNASTAHKPRVVIERIRDFYAAEYSKVNSTHRLGKHATQMYQESREAAAKFLNAESPDDIVFVRNTT